jgi:hypothetical protein
MIKSCIILVVETLVPLVSLYLSLSLSLSLSCCVFVWCHLFRSSCCPPTPPPSSSFTFSLSLVWLRILCQRYYCRSVRTHESSGAIAAPDQRHADCHIAADVLSSLVFPSAFCLPVNFSSSVFASNLTATWLPKSSSSIVARCALGTTLCMFFGGSCAIYVLSICSPALARTGHPPPTTHSSHSSTPAQLSISRLIHRFVYSSYRIDRSRVAGYFRSCRFCCIRSQHFFAPWLRRLNLTSSNCWRPAFLFMFAHATFTANVDPQPRSLTIAFDHCFEVL